MNNELLESLASARGIQSEYVDAWGKDTQVNPETQSLLLSAMGYPVNEPEALVEAVNFDTESLWKMPLDRVSIFRQDANVEIAIRLPITLVTSDLLWTVLTEDGKSIEGELQAIDARLVDVAHFDDLEYQEYLIQLDINDLPLGYHQLNFKVKGEKDVLAYQRLIVCPKACYKQDGIKQGKKVWGPSIQLYCLRSESNWGIGDFSDLKLLIKSLAQRGADYVGLNPIHALYPANPDSCSPYSPSSRRWLNAAYIDVTAVSGYTSKSVTELVSTNEFQQKIADVREVEWVDYKNVTELKISALKLTFAWFKKNAPAKDKKSLKDFIEQGGESLRGMALFDAIQDVQAAAGESAWGWPSWPDALQDYDSDEVKTFARKNKVRVEFYCYLQWVAETQLEKCQQTAIEEGMAIGIYRDLAVGVSAGSAEIWANKTLYCTDASVGAPADVLGPQGQNWGLPPMDPEELIDQGFQAIIDLFKANMQACGALRIDHVMALLRLWWVPAGLDAKDGAYVNYPVSELLALLCLESHKNNCLVIGEDLGTVPDGIRDLLADNAVYSYRVFFFEVAPDGGFFSPSHYPIQSMAALTTHDMPTLRGYWHCDDLNLGRELGVYPEEDVLQTLFANRHADKQRILDSLNGHCSLPDNTTNNADESEMSQSLNYAMQVHMAKGSSALLSLQLEDWLEMDKPVNVPGTCDEYPNWRRKLTWPLEAIFESPQINQLTQDLNQARQVASEQEA